MTPQEAVELARRYAAFRNDPQPLGSLTETICSLSEHFLSLHAECEAMRLVVEAACAWREFADRLPYGPRGDSELWAAIDAFRARKP